jgi:hypothetical protein
MRRGRCSAATLQGEGRFFVRSRDAGTGHMRWSAPQAAVAMSNCISAARYPWQSEPLGDGIEYRFVVRIATAAWPTGVETQNTDEHTAQADANSPAAPELTAHLV